MLNDDEIDKIDVALDAIIAMLKRFPHINGAGKTFNFSKAEQPDPLRFICEGNKGGYILEFGVELIKDYIDHIDLFCSVLHIQIMVQNIVPTNDWKCFRFTSSSGLEEVDLEIPRLHQRLAG